MTPETLDAIKAIAEVAFPAAGLIAGGWFGRRQGLKSAEAAVQEATNGARAAVTADWDTYTKHLLKRLEVVESRADTADKRLEEAERRAATTEARASKWEALYRLAVIYIRDLVKWASNVSHLGEVPDPPAELQAEIY